MAVTITKRPEREVEGKTGRWLAVNADYPVIFEFLRKDYDSVFFYRLADDFLEIQILNTDLTGEIKVGDSVYFSAAAYESGIANVTSVALTGTNATQIVTDFVLAGTWSSNIDFRNYVNILSSRLDYRVQIEAIDSITREVIADAEYRPYSSGKIEFDVSSYLNTSISIDNDYTPENKTLPELSKKFYLRWTEKQGGAETETTDGYNYYAASAAMQLQQTHAPNLLSFTAFNDDLTEAAKAKFLLDYDEAEYWPGYPFSISYLVQNDDEFPVFQRVEETFDQAGTGSGEVGTDLSNPDFNYINRIILTGNYAETVCELDVSIGSGISPSNSCQAISENDWAYNKFKVTNGFITGIAVRPNTPASIIATVNAYPVGELYQNGVQVDTLTYNAVRDLYEPTSGLDQIRYVGDMEARVNSVQVTTTSGDMCTPNFSQSVTSVEKLNIVPVASNVVLVATSFNIDSEVTVDYDYSDEDGDLENTGGTSVQIVRYDTEADCIANVNGAVIFTAAGDTLPVDLPAELGGQGGSYTILPADAGKYIRAKVTPVALTGSSPGLAAYSDCQEITGSPIVSYTHNKQTSHTFNFRANLGESYTIKWGDSTEQVVTGDGDYVGVSKTYASAGTYTVQLSGSGPDLTGIFMQNEGILTMDLSGMAGLGELNLESNSGLTALTPPSAHAGQITDIDLTGTALTQVDLTNLIFLAANVFLNGVSTITSFDLTGSTGTFIEFRADNCNLTGAMVIPSGLSMVSPKTATQGLIFDDNPLLTGLDVSNMSGDVDNFYIDECDIQGVLDLGSLNFTDATIRTMNNGGLTNVDISGCTGILKEINYTGCALSGTVNVSLPFTANAGNSIRMTSNITNAFSVDFTGSGGKMSTFRFDSCNYTGAFVCSAYEFTSAAITAIDSDAITSWDISGCTGSISSIYLYNSNNIAGTLDLSPFTFIGLYFRIEKTDISTITMGASSGTINLWYSYGCLLSGTLTLSSLQFLSGSIFYSRNNSGLTGIDFSNCSGEVHIMKVDTCNLTGVLDLSTLNFGTSSEFSLQTNPNLTGIAHGSSTGAIRFYLTHGTSATIQPNGFGAMTIRADADIEFNDSGLSAAEVDAWFNEIEPIAASSGATGSIVAGGTNAAPTAASSTARTNSVSAGYTITTS